MPVAHSINSCPSCDSNNRVEKVTSILKSQTSQTQGQMPVESVYTDSEGKVRSSTDYRNYSSSQASSLAQELAPPPKPTGNSYGFCLGYFIFQMLGIGFIGLIFILGGIMFLFSSIFTPQADAASRGVGIFISLLLIGAPIGGWLLFFYGYRYFKNKKAEEQKRIDETEGVAWQKAMQRWDKLYYCYRCDCVFIQGEESVPSREMRAYIYQR